MKCNKPYSVKSDNPKMSGSENPKSYMGGGMIKSYQKGGMVTKPRKMTETEFTRGMMENPVNKRAGIRDPRIKRAGMHNAALNITGQPYSYAPGERIRNQRIIERANMSPQVRNFTRGMMEDPRTPGAGMRNARKEIMNAPKYSEKEKMEMERVKGERTTKKTQDAYKRFYGK